MSASCHSCFKPVFYIPLSAWLLLVSLTTSATFLLPTRLLRCCWSACLHLHACCLLPAGLSSPTCLLLLHACCHPSTWQIPVSLPACNLPPARLLLVSQPASAICLLPSACFIPTCLIAASHSDCFWYMPAAFCLIDCCLSVCCCCYIPANPVCLTAARQPACYGFVAFNPVCLPNVTPCNFLLLLSSVVCLLFEYEERMPLENSKCGAAQLVVRRLAERQARVRISARHPMEAPLAERRRDEDSRRRASANGEG